MDFYCLLIHNIAVYHKEAEKARGGARGAGRKAGEEKVREEEEGKELKAEGKRLSKRGLGKHMRGKENEVRVKWVMSCHVHADQMLAHWREAPKFFFNTRDHGQVGLEGSS